MTLASTYQILHADSKEFLEQYHGYVIDCIFTSPNPIRNILDYEIISYILGNLCRRILKPQGSMWVHMEDYFNEEGSLQRWPQLFSRTMVTQDKWILRAERIWHIPVGEMNYFNDGKNVDNNRLILDHCYLFHFTQARYGYYNDFSYFGSGRVKGPIPVQPCSIFEDSTERVAPKEFATGFSKELIKQSILMSCPKGGTVLDPFAGTGTTGLIALELGRNFIGIEKDEKKIGPLKERLSKVS